MLTMKQIKTAINSMIKTKFPAIEIQSNDVREGFTRPSFFVQLDYTNRDTRQFVTEISITTRIYYFASDRNRTEKENMEIQDGLESIFNLNFAVDNRIITINETRAEVIDGVLNFEFDFDFLEARQIQDTSEKMQELSYNG